MGQDKYAVVICKVFADKVYLKVLASLDRQLHITLGIHDIDIGYLRPAVQEHGLPMSLGGIASAVVSGVALEDRAVNMVNYILHKGRAQEILISRLA